MSGFIAELGQNEMVFKDCNSVFMMILRIVSFIMFILRYLFGYCVLGFCGMKVYGDWVYFKINGFRFPITFV